MPPKLDWGSSESSEMATSPQNTELSPRHGVSADVPRRRRSSSKDSKNQSPLLYSDDWYGLPLPLVRTSRSPVLNNGQSRRRKPKSFHTRIWHCCILAFDLMVLVYVVQSAQRYFRPHIDETPIPALQDELKELEPAVSLFTNTLPETRSCDAMEPEEISFTLALQLSENRLWMLEHHCKLWGVSAHISIAIWTSIGSEEILEKLRSLGCDLSYLTMQTLSSKGHSGIDYPINELRNLALSGVATSHALMIDVDFWESTDLFDTLNSPSVRAALAEDPKLGIVVPAFEVRDLDCGISIQCRDRHLYWMPQDFEDLVIALGANKVLPYDSMNFSRQGSTDYRKWMKQGRGGLLEIPCISSTQYQPYLAFRVCEGLPPFQEQFVGHGRNNMAWMMHLRRLGYRLVQVGGSFVAHFPHQSSQAKLEWEKGSQATNPAKADYAKSALGRIDKTFLQFIDWLETNVADNSRISKCEDFDDDTKSLLANEI